MSYHNRKEVKTRIPHQCHGCGEMGTPGDRMEANSGIGETGWYSYYLCMDCAPIAKDYWDEIECDGEFSFGVIWEVMQGEGFQTHGELAAHFDRLRQKDKENRERNEKPRYL